MLAVGERRCLILILLRLNFLIRGGMGFERRCGFLNWWFFGGEERRAGEEGSGLLFVLVQSLHHGRATLSPSENICIVRVPVYHDHFVVIMRRTAAQRAVGGHPARSSEYTPGAG